MMGQTTESEVEMSNGDEKIIQCPVQVELQKLLNTPANQVIKNLKHKNTELKKANVTLRERLEGLKESNAVLHQEPDELRKELRGVKDFAERQSRKLAEIKTWFQDNNHPIQPGESIIEKLNNLEAIIRSQRQQLIAWNEKEKSKKGKKNGK